MLGTISARAIEDENSQHSTTDFVNERLQQNEGDVLEETTPNSAHDETQVAHSHLSQSILTDMVGQAIDHSQNSIGNNGEVTQNIPNTQRIQQDLAEEATGVLQDLNEVTGHVIQAGNSAFQNGIEGFEEFLGVGQD